MNDRLLERVLPRIAVSAKCWVWTGYRYQNYGMVNGGPGDRKPKRVHRLMYEHFVAPIPAGLDLDHLCKNRPCVRPDHLEPVSRQTNMARAFANRGVHHYPEQNGSNPWRAQITVAYKNLHLGWFPTQEAARAARATAQRRYVA